MNIPLFRLAFWTAAGYGVWKAWTGPMRRGKALIGGVRLAGDPSNPRRVSVLMNYWEHLVREAAVSGADKLVISEVPMRGRGGEAHLVMLREDATLHEAHLDGEFARELLQVIHNLVREPGEPQWIATDDTPVSAGERSPAQLETAAKDGKLTGTLQLPVFGELDP